MASSFHVLLLLIGLAFLPLSDCQRNGSGTNCLKSALPRSVKNMFDSCVQKAKNECSGVSSNSNGGETCSIPKSWTKLCPCMIEETQKIYGTCCNTTNSCNRTVEKISVTCIFNKSTEMLSSFHECCEQMNSFWYRRLNKVLFMALKDFLQRKYGESSGLQTSSRTIQVAAAQEICADLSESEFTEGSGQPYNCSTSERMLQATRCTFHNLVAHLQRNCDNDNEEDDDGDEEGNSREDDKSTEVDYSAEIDEQCDSLNGMMFTRWKENLTLPCDAVKEFDQIIHAAMLQEEQESDESTTLRPTTMPTTRRPNRSRGRDNRRKG